MKRTTLRSHLKAERVAPNVRFKANDRVVLQEPYAGYAFAPEHKVGEKATVISPTGTVWVYVRFDGHSGTEKILAVDLRKTR